MEHEEPTDWLGGLDLSKPRPTITTTEVPIYHELSTIFSDYKDTEEFTKLVANIKEVGQTDPIYVWKGSIVDGRHRHKACLELGIEPKFEDLSDEMSLDQVIGRVTARNLIGRVMSAGQRAMVAASLATMTRGGDMKSDQNVNLRFEKSIGCLADKLGISPKTVNTAKAIKRDAPDLAEKVSRGDMSLNAADVERKERKAKTFDQMLEDGDIVPQKSTLPVWFNGPKFNPMACAAGVLVGAADLYCSGEEGVGDLKQYLYNRATTGVSKPRDDYQIIALLKLRDAISEIEEDLLAYVGTTNQTH